MPWVFGQQTNFYDLTYTDDTALVHSRESRAAGGPHRGHSRSQQSRTELGQVPAAEVPSFPKSCAKPQERKSSSDAMGWIFPTYLDEPKWQLVQIGNTKPLSLSVKF